MAISTTSHLWKKPLQFVVETTEGTTPTASPVFTVCPPVKSLSIKKDGGFVDAAQIGVEDLAKVIEGLRTFETSITFYPTATTTDEAFFQRAIQASNPGTPAGTISETHSMLYSFYLNNVENFVLLKGSRAKSVSIKMAMGQPHEITIEFVHMDIIKPISTANAGLTTPTFVTTFNAGAVHDWLSGGATPVSLISQTLDCTEFNCTINRNTTQDHILGAAGPHSSQPHGRRISGDCKNLYTIVTAETSFRAPTQGTITAVLSTGVSTLTITNAYITSLGVDYGADDTEATVEALGFKGVACTYA